MRRAWQRVPYLVRTTLFGWSLMVPVVIGVYVTFNLDVGAGLVIAIVILPMSLLMRRLNRDDAFTDRQWKARERAINTGIPSGDPAVDASAIEVLEPLARRPRLARGYLIGIAVAAALLPIAAWLRSGNPWWLLLDLSTGIGMLALAASGGNAPAERLASLRAAAADTGMR